MTTSWACKQFLPKREDKYAIESVGVDGFEEFSGSFLSCIMDGHGGHACASYCQKHLFPTFLSEVAKGWRKSAQGKEPMPSTESQFNAAAQRAFRLLHDNFVAEDRGTAGTTCCMSAMVGRRIYVANCGDSRCIFVQPPCSANGYVVLSNDHVFEDEAEQQAALCRDPKVRFYRLVDRNTGNLGSLHCWPGGLATSRNLGDSDAANAICREPEMMVFDIPTEGGWLLMGSDGLWNAVSNDLAKDIVRQASEPEAACRQLCQKVLQLRGVHDDLTVLVVRVAPAADLCETATFGARGGGAAKPLAAKPGLLRRLCECCASLNTMPDWQVSCPVLTDKGTIGLGADDFTLRTDGGGSLWQRHLSAAAPNTAVSKSCCLPKHSDNKDSIEREKSEWLLIHPLHELSDSLDRTVQDEVRIVELG